MNVGDVFLWKKFPFREGGKAKDRWFIYLGTYIGAQSPVTLVLTVTTTTQLHYFESEGSRSDHHFVRFNRVDNWGFEADCVADFDNDFRIRTQVEIEEAYNNGDIVIRGQICERSMLQRIKNAVSTSRTIDHYIKRCVMDNLQNAMLSH